MIVLPDVAWADAPAPATEAAEPPPEPAEEAWQARWYALPNANVTTLGGRSGLVYQARVSGEVGRIWRQVDKPHWLIQTRLLATGLYGLNSGSVGGGLQLGAFAGPDGKWVRLAVGPDLWLDGYGGPNATDLFLPVSLGASLPVTVIGKITDPVQAIVNVTPGWPLRGDRWSDELVGMGQLSVMAGAMIPKWGLVLGWSWAWNGAGHYAGPVISGGLPR